MRIAENKRGGQTPRNFSIILYTSGLGSDSKQTADCGPPPPRLFRLLLLFEQKESVFSPVAKRSSPCFTFSSDLLGQSAAPSFFSSRGSASTTGYVRPSNTYDMYVHCMGCPYYALRPKGSTRPAPQMRMIEKGRVLPGLKLILKLITDRETNSKLHPFPLQSGSIHHPSINPASSN